MPEQQENKKVFSLLEVTLSIQRTLQERYTSIFWVKAEMNKLNYYPHSGHCYPDLVEKSEGRIIAQIRSVLWKDDYHRINHQFRTILGTPLKDGIKMLFCAKVTFDPAHGLALRIVDIDPSFSLGELEREKLETIEVLKKEGLFARNKSLSLPLVPQRIAVISVQTSKGYADFLNVIENNTHGFRFFHLLFPSLLQGERAVESILYQLERIRKVITHFDVVAIIRGGGAEVGLSSFNHVALARAICTFPLPVITGIGHATNETVAEMVSHKNAITPTDLANFLVERFHQFYLPVRRAEERLVSLASSVLKQQEQSVTNMVRYFKSVTENVLLDHRHTLEKNSTAIVNNTRHILADQRQKQNNLLYAVHSSATTFTRNEQGRIFNLQRSLEKDVQNNVRHQDHVLANLERVIRTLDPFNVLKRGYSITRINGQVVKSAGEVQEGDTIQTILASGTLTSEIKKIEKE